MFPNEPSREELLSACSDISPDDGVDPLTWHRPQRPRVKNRKALQLCAQVAETFSEVLSGELGDDLLRDLAVVSVTPAPDSSRLRVTVAVPADGPGTADVREHLDRAYGKLRSEIAAAIHRKKVPQLLFVVDR